MRGLIIGIANEHSLAYGCAKVLQEHDLAITYLNDKAYPYVQPLAEALECSLLLPLDVTKNEEMDSLFEILEKEWKEIDFLIHSIAFCPQEDLHNPLSEVTFEGLSTAIQISWHSFLVLAKKAKPLMKKGGSLITMSYYGAEKVVPHYNIMGPIKAALESSVRYLACELGSHNIRVNAISAGPLKTRAANGLQWFDQLLDKTKQKAPLKTPLTIEQIGEACEFLIHAPSITGHTLYVDNGYHLMA